MKIKQIILPLALCLLLCACTAAPAQSEGAENAVQPPLATAETPVSTAAPETSAADEAFFQATKDYILTGQDDLPSAEQLHWSPAFLEEVDFASVYSDYLASGGAAEDTKAFAAYLSEHAVAPANWKELFEKDLLNDYAQTPERYEDLGDGVYQVYVKIDGTSVPFVAVDSRTGWYHG